MIPCGEYEFESLFGEVTRLFFRYIPRAAKHTGRHGVFVDDSDAGMVLIGLYDVAKGEVVREGNLYGEYWAAWLGAKLVEKRCAWCGRKSPELDLHLGCEIKAKKLQGK